MILTIFSLVILEVYIENSREPISSFAYVFFILINDILM